MSALATSVRGLRALAVRKAEITYPTGNPNFSVLQAFPAGFTAEEADPFLMLDNFGPKPSAGLAKDADTFPVDWHPHRGMDILTYLVQGVGRHADSLGNRETYATPGAQWISVGSGIMHAEAGGTPAGEMEEGFQIWINTPSALKMAPPRYGTHPPHELPLLALGAGTHVRLLAGALGEAVGPFKASADIQIADYSIAPGTSVEHALAPQHDNCLVYVYRGAAAVGGAEVPQGHVARMDLAPAPAPPASGTQAAPQRSFQLTALGEAGCALLVFAGRQLRQQIAWRGPFVMTTQEEIALALKEYRDGTLLKVRAPWDFFKASAAPPKGE